MNRVLPPGDLFSTNVNHHFINPTGRKELPSRPFSLLIEVSITSSDPQLVTDLLNDLAGPDQAVSAGKTVASVLSSGHDIFLTLECLTVNLVEGVSINELKQAMKGCVTMCLGMILYLCQWGMGKTALSRDLILGLSPTR